MSTLLSKFKVFANKTGHGCKNYIKLNQNHMFYFWNTFEPSTKILQENELTIVQHKSGISGNLGHKAWKSRFKSALKDCHHSNLTSWQYSSVFIRIINPGIVRAILDHYHSIIFYNWNVLIIFDFIIKIICLFVPI